MVFDRQMLKGKIIGKYGTQAVFADKLGVVPLTVSRKITCESPITDQEIVVWCDMLDIPTDEIQLYFFTAKVHS